MKKWRIFTIAFLTLAALVFCVNFYAAVLGINMPQSAITAALLGIAWMFLFAQHRYWWNH